MKKRSLISLLAIAILLPAVTACGLNLGTAGKSESTLSGNSASYADSPASAETEPVAECAESPAIDYYTDAEYCTEAAADSYYSKNTACESYDVLCDGGYYPDPYDRPIPDASGETYEAIDENGFKDVNRSPLSTFAADVDTASYANMRRFVNSGYGLYDFTGITLRAEEMVNYFKYDYASPKSGERFGVDSTVSDCPWNRDHKLMILGVSTKDLKENKKPDSNIVFLIDVSGSMNSENKLPLLIESMKLMTENLTGNDRVSIVTYANGTNIVLDGVTGSAGSKINKAFSRLSAGGGTNGEGGIELAYEIAQKHFIKGGNNRIILATDGDFNIGKCSGDELEDLIGKKKETGIFLSVLGFGMGNYNDVTAETLADSGNGNYSYIDSLAEAKKVLVDEFNSTLYTVAKDTKLQVEFNPAMVSKYRLIGYENRALQAEDFTDDTKDGGEIGAGHQVTAVYEIELADENSGSSLKYQSNTLSDKGRAKDEWCTLSIAYKDPDKNSSEYLEFPVDAGDYTQRPSDDFILATSVAEYSMALSDSEYLADMTREEALDQAIRNVEKMDPDDELIQEFLDLMRTVAERESDSVRYDDTKWYE
ncbi:MAG: von Willebrand factor type A domain-containing protein [Lachnospiraceae bacterium]|nr:von Willebrand factor type A domain-containing protein [Lachnospiraceae bacterium]